MKRLEGYVLLSLAFYATLIVSFAKDLNVNVNLKRTIAVSDERFLSLTIDPVDLLTGNVLSENFEKSIILARSLAPAYIRFGGPRGALYYYGQGSPQDIQSSGKIFLSESDLIRTHKWAEISGLDAIDSIWPDDRSDLIGDVEEAREIISFSDLMNFKANWQLGYECLERCNLSAGEFARMTINLRKVLNEFPRYSRSAIIGPDIRTINNEKQMMDLQEYFDVAGPAISAVTWHPDINSITLGNEGIFIQQDNLKKDKDELYKTIGHLLENKPLWIAESKPEEYKSLYIGALVLARRLGNVAKLNAKVFMRQPVDLIKPTPDYWVSFLHKNLVGREVFDAKIQANKNHVYLYCQCAKASSRYKKGSIMIFGVNMHPESIDINLRGAKITTVHEYLLTPGFDTPNRMFAETVLLNNRTLTLDNGMIPSMEPIIFNEPNGLSLNLPSGGIGFWILPGLKAKSCMESQESRPPMSSKIRHQEPSNETETIKLLVPRSLETKENSTEKAHTKKTKQNESSTRISLKSEIRRLKDFVSQKLNDYGNAESFLKSGKSSESKEDDVPRIRRAKSVEITEKYREEMNSKLDEFKDIFSKVEEVSSADERGRIIQESVRELVRDVGGLISKIRVALDEAAREIDYDKKIMAATNVQDTLSVLHRLLLRVNLSNLGETSTEKSEQDSVRDKRDLSAEGHFFPSQTDFEIRDRRPRMESFQSPNFLDRPSKSPGENSFYGLFQTQPIASFPRDYVLLPGEAKNEDYEVTYKANYPVYKPEELTESSKIPFEENYSSGDKGLEITKDPMIIDSNRFRSGFVENALSVSSKENLESDEEELKSIEEHLKSIEEDLKSTKEYLRPTKDLKSTEEDLESSKEDLKSTKEDLESTKEYFKSTKDLKSTKEDLESSKEDLKSTKEDLESTKEYLKSTKDLKSTKEDLESTKEDLKSTKEDLESSKEYLKSTKDLKSSKEDLKSTKEDLKSTKEDLESSKEYLESTKDLKFSKENLKSTNEDLKSTKDLKSSKEDLKSSKENLKSTKEDLESSKEYLESTRDLKSTKRDLKFSKENLKSTNEDLKSTKDLKSSKQNLKSTKEDLKFTKEDLKSSKEDLRSTKDLKSTKRDLKFSKENLKSTNEDLKSTKDLKSSKQNLKSTKEDLKSTKEDLESSKEYLESTKDLKSTKRDLKFSKENLKSTNEDLKSTKQNLKSTKEDLKSTKENLKSTKDLKSTKEYLKSTAEDLKSAEIAITEETNRSKQIHESQNTQNQRIPNANSNPEQKELGYLTTDGPYVRFRRKSTDLRSLLEEEMIQEDDGNSKDCNCRVIRHSADESEKSSLKPGTPLKPISEEEIPFDWTRERPSENLRELGDVEVFGEVDGPPMERVEEATFTQTDKRQIAESSSKSFPETTNVPFDDPNIPILESRLEYSRNRQNSGLETGTTFNLDENDDVSAKTPVRRDGDTFFLEETMDQVEKEEESFAEKAASSDSQILLSSVQQKQENFKENFEERKENFEENFEEKKENEEKIEIPVKETSNVTLRNNSTENTTSEALKKDHVASSEGVGLKREANASRPRSKLGQFCYDRPMDDSDTLTTMKRKPNSRDKLLRKELNGKKRESASSKRLRALKALRELYRELKAKQAFKLARKPRISRKHAVPSRNLKLNNRSRRKMAEEPEIVGKDETEVEEKRRLKKRAIEKSEEDDSNYDSSLSLEREMNEDESLMDKLISEEIRSVNDQENSFQRRNRQNYESSKVLDHPKNGLKEKTLKVGNLEKEETKNDAENGVKETKSKSYVALMEDLEKPRIFYYQRKRKNDGGRTAAQVRSISSDASSNRPAQRSQLEKSLKKPAEKSVKQFPRTKDICIIDPSEYKGGNPPLQLYESCKEKSESKEPLRESYEIILEPVAYKILKIRQTNKNEGKNEDQDYEEFPETTGKLLKTLIDNLEKKDADELFKRLKERNVIDVREENFHGSFKEESGGNFRREVEEFDETSENYGSFDPNESFEMIDVDRRTPFVDGSMEKETQNEGNYGTIDREYSPEIVTDDYSTEEFPFIVETRETRKRRDTNDWLGENDDWISFFIGKSPKTVDRISEDNRLTLKKENLDENSYKLLKILKRNSGKTLQDSVDKVELKSMDYASFPQSLDIFPSSRSKTNEGNGLFDEMKVEKDVEKAGDDRNVDLRNLFVSNKWKSIGRFPRETENEEKSKENGKTAKVSPLQHLDESSGLETSTFGPIDDIDKSLVQKVPIEKYTAKENINKRKILRKSKRIEEGLPTLLEKSIPHLGNVLVDGIKKAENLTGSVEKLIENLDEKYNKTLNASQEANSKSSGTAQNVFRNAIVNVRKFFTLLGGITHLLRT